MDRDVESLLKNWQKRNITGLYCADKEGAAEKMLELIPASASIGFSGSVSLEQLDIIRRLEERDNKVLNPYRPGLSRQESLQIRKEATLADYYLASPNAITRRGELVFFSAYGNRTSGIAYAKNLIVVCGINKITDTLEAAMKRAREHATPINCERLNWGSACLKHGTCHEDICFFPEYKRMCCQVLIIEAEISPGRMKVLLIGENLGY